MFPSKLEPIGKLELSIVLIFIYDMYTQHITSQQSAGVLAPRLSILLKNVLCMNVHFACVISFITRSFVRNTWNLC